MTSRLIIRPQADRDIDEIAEHIFETDPAAALRFLDNVYETMKKLASMPSLGSPCEFTSRAFANLRTWPVRKFKKHIIFFQPLDDGVEVIRVLHGARDYPALFG